MNCFLKIKYFSFHSFKCCSRSTDYPKNVLDASEIAAPGKQPLIEQIFSLTAKFPTLLSQILLATAQSLTLAVKVPEAGSSLQLTDPGCLSCKAWSGCQRTETWRRTAPSIRAGTLRPPTSWHIGYITSSNMLIPVMPMWRERSQKPHGPGGKWAQGRNEENRIVRFSGPRLYLVPSFVNPPAAPLPPTKRTMLHEGLCSTGFIHRRLSAYGNQR